MAYGSDITEGLPLTLSNPANAAFYSSGNESYDIAVNGQPFFMATSDETPYRRETAPYRKQQIDQSTEPGEQTLTGWWVRSQSSFHNGSGIKFYDPAAGETVAYRFADSKGVDVWTKGQATLLNSCTPEHITTGAIQSNSRPFQFLRTIKWGSTSGVLLHDEYDVDKIDGAGTVTHFIDYLTAGAEPVRAICDDGTYAYWMSNATEGGANKLHMFKKPLTGSSASTADETTMYTETGLVITNAVAEYIKNRIVACINNKVYEISPTGTGTSLPTAVYTHPSSSYVYTSVAASGSAIYVAGYNGIQSTIQKFTLSSAGAMPVLSSAVTAAEMPVGERIFKIFYYLDYLMIGTDKGIRAASIQTDGSIIYGPLIVETTQPCYDFTARDRFIWCATSVAGEPGLIRIDLNAQIEPLLFAYANDVYYASGSTAHATTACAFINETDTLAFTSAHAATVDGAIYLEQPNVLLPSGYITTGRIRYSTLEPKVFKVMKGLVDNTNGGMSIESIDASDNHYSIGNFAQGDFTPEVNVSYPVGPQEYLSFKFTLTRNETTTSLGAIFDGYQLKALPAVPRQRLIQYPLACYDREMDAFGIQVGHEGAAFEKLVNLETTENGGDTIRVEDFRTGESYLGIIEELQLVNRTPTDKRFSGFGGILLLTIRTI